MSTITERSRIPWWAYRMRDAARVAGVPESTLTAWAQSGRVRTFTWRNRHGYEVTFANRDDVLALARGAS